MNSDDNPGEKLTGYIVMLLEQVPYRTILEIAQKNIYGTGNCREDGRLSQARVSGQVSRRDCKRLSNRLLVANRCC
jgi:hypothetical protein